MPEKVLRDYRPEDKHAFVRVGSYSTQRGCFETKFRVVYGVEPRTLAIEINNLINKLNKKNQ